MTLPVLSPLSTLHAIEHLLESDAPASRVGRATGLNRAQTTRLLTLLARSGLVRQAADRVGTCTLNVWPGMPQELPHQAAQTILAHVPRARTVTGLVQATGSSQAAVLDTLRRSMLQGQLACVCVGHLALFEVTWKSPTRTATTIQGGGSTP